MPKPPKARRPNVIVLLYDSLLPCALGAFGGKPPTEAFDYFAHTGARFHRAAAHSVQLEDAVGAILTGQYPTRSGIHKLVMPGERAITSQGYQNEKLTDLVEQLYRQRYMIRLHGLEFLSACMPRAAWSNVPATAPHLRQLDAFFKECGGAPFLLVDRFHSTAFPWIGGCLDGTPASLEERNALALAALRDKRARGLMLRRMQDTVLLENGRLARIIGLMRTHALLDNTIVAITGVPGAHSPEAATALSMLTEGEGGVPDFPAIIWYPKSVPAQSHQRAMIRHIDLAPTLLELAGIAPAESMDGASLASALRRAKAPTTRDSLLFFDNRIVMSGTKRGSLELTGRPAARSAAARRIVSLLCLTGLPSPNRALLNPYIIPKTSIFILGFWRSATMFLASFFQRPEFSHVLCRGHLWPQYFNVNIRRENGLISDEETIRELWAARNEVMASPRGVMVSVSHNNWAIVDLLARVYPNSRFILVTRDPRAVFTSAANHPAATQRERARQEPPPLWLGDKVTLWPRVMTRAFADVRALGERGLVVKYEEIFDRERGFPGMKAMAGFIKDEIAIPAAPAWMAGALGESVNASPKLGNSFQSLPAPLRRTLMRAWGPAMKQLGYKE